MQEVVIGILAVVVGGAFCFRGYFAMRLIIPMWGAFAGFMLGAGLISGLGDVGFLGTAAGWVVGFVVALVFAAIAYLYYEVAIVLGMAGIGFALGTSLMVALGVSWSWLTVLVGVVAGALLAFVAIAADLPMFLLALLTATGGASAVVAGLMLLFGTIDTADLESVSTTERLQDDWWWYAIYIALVVAGLLTQLRTVDELRTTLRQSWADAGGKELRSTGHAGPAA